MQPLEDLIKTKKFWMVRLHLDLFNAVEAFRERKGWNRSQLADHLGVTKSYVSQVLNGDFDRRLSSLVTLTLAVGVVPNTTFQLAFSVTNADVSPMVTGLVTGTQQRVLEPNAALGTGAWLTSISYYDTRERPVQQIATERNGGQQRSSFTYTFTGQLGRGDNHRSQSSAIAMCKNDK